LRICTDEIQRSGWLSSTHSRPPHRVNIGDNEPTIHQSVEAILIEKLHDIKYQTIVRMGKAFMNTSTDSQLVKTAQKVALRQDLKTQPIELGGASDTRHFSDRPIEVIDFGPIGFGVHGSNEHVVLESIPQTAQFYIQLAEALHTVKRA